ncbi:MAG: hypothetical protein N2255_08665 [Kiritimatiellae bacterium]|nr:hypothetical protein [Kiritimatiellia bacterium]
MKNTWGRVAAASGTMVAFFSLPHLVGAAGIHEKGTLSFSVGGSLSHIASRDRRPVYTFTYVGDELRKIPSEAAGEDYSTYDGSLYLAAGYFLLTGLELGFSSSLLVSRRPDTDNNDLDVYDGLLYSKYFFHTRTRLTPYVKFSGGRSLIRSGTYREDNTKAVATMGLEFFGAGPFTFYVELSNEYKALGGDMGGSEWEQRVYLGISFYATPDRKKAKPSTPASTSGIPQEFTEAEMRFLESLQKIDEKVYEEILRGGQ